MPEPLISNNKQFAEKICDKQYEVTTANNTRALVQFSTPIAYKVMDYTRPQKLPVEQYPNNA